MAFALPWTPSCRRFRASACVRATTYKPKPPSTGLVCERFSRREGAGNAQSGAPHRERTRDAEGSQSGSNERPNRCWQLPTALLLSAGASPFRENAGFASVLSSKDLNRPSLT